MDNLEEQLKKRFSEAEDKAGVDESALWLGIESSVGVAAAGASFWTRGRILTAALGLIFIGGAGHWAYNEYTTPIASSNHNNTTESTSFSDNSKTSTSIAIPEASSTNENQNSKAETRASDKAVLNYTADASVGESPSVQSSPSTQEEIAQIETASNQKSPKQTGPGHESQPDSNPTEQIKKEGDVAGNKVEKNPSQGLIPSSNAAGESFASVNADKDDRNSAKKESNKTTLIKDRLQEPLPENQVYQQSTETSNERLANSNLEPTNAMDFGFMDVLGPELLDERRSSIERGAIISSPSSLSPLDKPNSFIPNYLTISAGPNTSLIAGKQGVSNDAQIDTDVNTNAQMGMAIQGMAGWQLSGRWSLRSGIQYAKHRTQFNYRAVEFTVLTVDDQIVSLSTDSNGVISPVFGSADYDATRARTVIHHNEYTWFSVPVILSYRIADKGSWCISMGAGAGYTFVKSQSGRQLDNQNKIRDFESGQNQALRQHQLSLHTELGLRYELITRLALSLEPRLTYIPGSRSDWNTSVGDDSSLGLNLGLRYRLR